MGDKDEYFLKEGDIFELKEGDCFYAENFPRFFLCDNEDYDFSLDSGNIYIGGISRGLDTSIFIGEYIVVKSIYSKGKKVFAKKIINDPLLCKKQKIISDFEIIFYQTIHCEGYTYEHSIINRIPIRKSKIKYIVDDL